MNISDFLARLNEEYLALHTEYERLYWISYMGDNTVSADFQKAQARMDDFRESTDRADAIEDFLRMEKDETLRNRLVHWKTFFDLYRTPKNLGALRERITALEDEIRLKRAEMKTGYTDPQKGKWCEVPENKLTLMIATEPDEALRRACFLGKEETAEATLDEYVELVGLRNEYARGLGFRDFYHYKARIEEQMESDELFRIFDDIRDALTPFCFGRLEEMEKTSPNLRAPWNLRYAIAGDFTREEDKYFPLETVLDAWGRSFSALGIGYRGGTLRLDLLERKGKYSNGFCHMPVPVHYTDGKRISGEANFTCNAIVGQVGSGVTTGLTLFHEGGHAAHFLNMDQADVCLNTEYPPCSTAWAETQSMFLDTMFSSVEWKMRYARTLEGEAYPFSLYEAKVKKTFLLEPIAMLRMASVIEFERRVYSAENLDTETVREIARETSVRYNGFNEPSLYLLTIPHIYSWGASCAYHGYALATLALTQWREHLYDTYGYIVDNPVVGEEMTRVWKFGSGKGFAELVELATGQKLSPQAYLNQIVGGEEQALMTARIRLHAMEHIPVSNKEPDLDARIYVVNGTETISSNEDGFAALCSGFRAYVEKRKQKLR